MNRNHRLTSMEGACSLYKKKAESSYQWIEFDCSCDTRITIDAPLSVYAIVDMRDTNAFYYLLVVFLWCAGSDFLVGCYLPNSSSRFNWKISSWSWNARLCLIDRRQSTKRPSLKIVSARQTFVQTMSSANSVGLGEEKNALAQLLMQFDCTCTDRDKSMINIRLNDDDWR